MVAPSRPGWSANSAQNQFLRTETNQGGTENAMLDADGPDGIVRLRLKFLEFSEYHLKQ